MSFYHVFVSAVAIPSATKSRHHGRTTFLMPAIAYFLYVLYGGTRLIVSKFYKKHGPRGPWAAWAARSGRGTATGRLLVATNENCWTIQHSTFLECWIVERFNIPSLNRSTVFVESFNENCWTIQHSWNVEIIQRFFVESFNVLF